MEESKQKQFIEENYLVEKNGFIFLNDLSYHGKDEGKVEEMMEKISERTPARSEIVFYTYELRHNKAKRVTGISLEAIQNGSYLY